MVRKTGRRRSKPPACPECRAEQTARPRRARIPGSSPNLSCLSAPPPTFGGVIAKVEPLTSARSLRGPFDYALPGAMSALGVGSVVTTARSASA